MKKIENELMSGMQHELSKQASDETPKLVKAAECLHAALEIFEEAGLSKQANQVLKLLSKIAQSHKHPEHKLEQRMPSISQMMESGLTQRDWHDFARGEPRATAKFNIILRKLGLSDHEIEKFLGPGHLMKEHEALQALNPNEPGSMLEFKSIAPESSGPSPEEEMIEFKSLAYKPRKPSRPDRISDSHIKGLTPERQIENLKNHGTQFNLADDASCAEEAYDKWISQTRKPAVLTHDDMAPELANLLDLPSFDMDASDDELNMEIDDSLEVFDADMPLEDFEDEKNSR